MKNYLILVAVFAAFISINAGSIAGSAAAPQPAIVPQPPSYGYNHTLTPVPPIPQNTFVTDVVTPIPSFATFVGKTMTFYWMRPPHDGYRRTTIACRDTSPKISNSYKDSCVPDTTGKWQINSYESYTWRGRSMQRASVINFNVVQAPEFNKLGLVVPLFLIGIFYMGMKKIILK